MTHSWRKYTKDIHPTNRLAAGRLPSRQVSFRTSSQLGFWSLGAMKGTYNDIPVTRMSQKYGDCRPTHPMHLRFIELFTPKDGGTYQYELNADWWNVADGSDWYCRKGPRVCCFFKWIVKHYTEQPTLWSCVPRPIKVCHLGQAAVAALWGAPRTLYRINMNE